MPAETLRPSAAGDECSIPQEIGAACPNHYLNVDEVIPDDATTVIGNNTTSYLRDLYNLPAHSEGSGIINHITIYFRCAAAANTAVAMPSQKSGDTVTDGTEITVTTTWTTFSEQFIVNPATTAAWTWDEIDALQIGVALKKTSTNSPNCTQVYVVVDYTNTETLRPDAAGDECNIDNENGAACPNHYLNVDEAVSDDATTNVSSTSATYLRDFYNIAASGINAGDIDHIDVYVNCYGAGTPDRESIKICIKSGTGSGAPDTSSESSGITAEDGAYRVDSNEWSINPATAAAWTWDEIDKLQIGVSLKTTDGINGTACTQVWVVVDFTAVTPKTSSDTGSGVDAKVSGNPLAIFPVRSETGGGVDAKLALVAALVRADVGSGVDAILNFLASLTKADSGVGADTILNYIATLIKQDGGEGIEHILDRDLVIEEVGTGLDTILSLLGKLASDSGICSLENTYIHIYEGVIQSSDVGEGTDASAQEALLQRAETGVGADILAGRALYTKEIGGFFDWARVLTAIIAGTGETGTGVEASLIAFYQKKADSGEGVDVSALTSLFVGEDSGAGAEARALMVTKFASDNGQGIETVLNYLRQLIDSGEGAEIVQLIGAVGRRMRMVVYQQEAFDLKVYTSELGK